MNVSGGQTCTMTEARGYARKGDSELLVSGIYSGAAPWPFEYNEDDTVHAEPMPKFKAYNPVGMIKQAPACRVDYKGKGTAGGRKCPRGYIGAAERAPKGAGKGVKVHFCVDSTKVTMGLGKGEAWGAVLREALVAKLEARR